MEKTFLSFEKVLFAMVLPKPMCFANFFICRNWHFLQEPESFSITNGKGGWEISKKDWINEKIFAIIERFRKFLLCQVIFSI